jgi:VanZ family protein
MHINIRKTALLLGLLAIGIISLLPREALPETGMSDKLGHFMAYGALALLGWLACAKETTRRRIMIGLVIYGAALEGLQMLVPGRFFSTLDMIANALGVGAAYAVLFLIARWRRGP